MRLSSALLALLFFATAMPAAEQTKAILVLDASGSMWGTINGKTKIEIARDAVAKVVAGLDENVQLGLMAYGHRRKGDCADIELLIPPGPLNKQAFMSKVNALQPLGNTPLTKAVELAAEALKYEENAATVILVSDGLETCGGDPCSLAQKLEAAGVKFTTHVVAFDLTQQEAQKIECLAKDTGGMFLSASDAGSLQHALQTAVKSVEVKKSGASFLAKDSKEGKALEGATWTMYKSKSDETPLSKLDKPQGTAEITPSTYLAVASWNGQQIEVPFEVKEGQMTSVEAAFGPAILRLQAIESPDSAPLKGDETSLFWKITKINPDGSESELTDLPPIQEEPTLELPAGKYLVKLDRGMNVNFGTIQQEEIVELKPGESRTVKLIALAGTMNISTAYGGIPIPDGTWVEVYPLDEKGNANLDKRLVYVQSQPVPALLAPGKFAVRSEIQGAKAAGTITVEAGKVGNYTLDFEAGIGKVTATKGGVPSADIRWWNVYQLTAEGQKDGTPLYLINSPTLEAFLPVGEFLVTYEVEGIESAGTKIKIEKGKTAEASVEMK